MCLARLFRLMDLRTRYTHVFSVLASGRGASWAKRGASIHTDSEVHSNKTLVYTLDLNSLTSCRAASVTLLQKWPCILQLSY